VTEPPAAPGDTLLFENERVRVWSMTPAPGGTFDFHRHHHDHVVLWPEAGRSPGQELGEPEWGITQDAEPGFVLHKTVGRGGPLRPHRIRNLGDTPRTRSLPAERLSGNFVTQRERASR
jgi:hypothetical protein